MNRYTEWGLTVLCWDGLLPVVVVGVPAIIAFALPKQDDLHVLANIAIPIVAFFVRCVMAHRHFQGEEHYGWQGVIFVLAIFYLIFVETLLILFGDLRNGVRADDWYVLGLMYLVYLAMVGLSLFPFRRAEKPAEVEADVGPQFCDTK
jgi:hypothetical protein